MLIAFFILSPQLQAQQFPPAFVHVATAELKPLAPYAWVSGTLVSRNHSRIASEVSGRLVSLVEIGETVEAGEAIAQIDDTQLKLREKELTASVESNRARFSFLTSEVERISALAERNLSAKNDLDEAISNRDIARGELLEAEARLAQVRQDIRFAEVRAPFTGMVTERLRNLGEYIERGNGIVTLVETDALEASVFAPITNYPYLKKGMMLAVESPMGNATAPLKSIINVANTRSHLMELRLDMKELNWPIGLNLKVAVTNGEQLEVIAIPRDALVLRREGITVFRIKEDNTAEQVSVRVGIGAGELVQVIGDIKPGDKIVIRGAERLSPGQPVQIKPENDHLVTGP